MMSVSLVWILAVLVGHMGLFLFCLNRIEAIGWRERIKPAILLALGILWALGAILLFRPGFTLGSSSFISCYALLCLAVAFVGMPLSTLALRLRKIPPGIRQKQKDELDLAARHPAGALVGLGAHNWMLRLPGCTSLKLRPVEWSVALTGLPNGLDGLSLLHLSDLHFSPAYDIRFFEDVVETAASWESDLVLFTGDLIDDEACLE
jgi:uncharacterized protein